MFLKPWMYGAIDAKLWRNLHASRGNLGTTPPAQLQSRDALPRRGCMHTRASHAPAGLCPGPAARVLSDGQFVHCDRGARHPVACCRHGTERRHNERTAEQTLVHVTTGTSALTCCHSAATENKRATHGRYRWRKCAAPVYGPHTPPRALTCPRPHTCFMKLRPVHAWPSLHACPPLPGCTVCMHHKLHTLRFISRDAQAGCAATDTATRGNSNSRSCGRGGM